MLRFAPLIAFTAMRRCSTSTHRPAFAAEPACHSVQSRPFSRSQLSRLQRKSGSGSMRNARRACQSFFLGDRRARQPKRRQETSGSPSINSRLSTRILVVTDKDNLLCFTRLFDSACPLGESWSQEACRTRLEALSRWRVFSWSDAACSGPPLPIS